MNSDYMFDKYELINYIYNLLHLASPLKIQKTLYLLYGYYGATYGLENNLETGIYPTELFNANFIAGKYGPFDPEIKDYLKSNEPKTKIYIPKTVEEKNIHQFIINIVNQIDNVDDFSLIQLVKEDECWKLAYKIKENEKIPNYLIISEYKKKV